MKAILASMAPKLRARLEVLLLAEKQDSGVALTSKLERLDIVLFSSLMPRGLQCMFMHIAQIEHMPGRAPMADIGNIVRHLMLRWNTDNVLFRMYQYSMPFVKHNRLQFPAFALVSQQDLHHMLNVVQNLMLGVHQWATKMPTWTTRHQLMSFFHKLLTGGSVFDLYIFLSSHVYLLRLALIENYVTFTSTCMPLEVSLMRCFVDSSYDHARVSRLVCYIVDNFRMTALQEELDFAKLEARAQVAIERCNRTCRSMQNIHGGKLHEVKIELERSTFQLAMQTPRVGGIHGMQLLHAARSHDLLQIAAMHEMQSRVVRYPLPVQLQEQQYAFMAAQVGSVMGVQNRTILHICLRCHSGRSVTHGNMRVVHGEAPMCIQCSSNHFTIAVQTLGCIVRVHRASYYFCRFCASVHKWNGNPASFFMCVEARKPPGVKASRACAVCYRLQTTSSVSVLDVKLGVRCSVWLCARHLPAAAQLAYVHDVASLGCLLKHRAQEGW